MLWFLTDLVGFPLRFYIVSIAYDYYFLEIIHLVIVLEQQRKNRLPQEGRETDDEISVACSSGCCC